MKRKMVAIAVVVTILLVSLVIVIEKMTEERLEAVIRHSHEESMRSFIEHTQGKLARLKASLLILSDSDLMREAILSPNELLEENTFKRVTAFYKGVLRHRTDINAVTLSDSNNEHIFTIEKVNGKVVIQLNPEQVVQRSKPSSEEIRFVTADGVDVIVSPLMFSPLTQDKANLLAPKINMQVPVKGRHGENIGSVSMDFNASLLLDELSELTERSMGEAFLIDHSGRFLHSERGKTRISEYFDQTLSFQTGYPEIWNSIDSNRSESLPEGKELIYAKKFCIFSDCPLDEVNNSGAIQQPWWLLNIYNPANVNSQGLMSARWYLLYALVTILFSIAVIILYSAWRLIKANSSLRRAKEALESQDKLFNAFMDNSPTLVYVKDREGKYQIVNKAYANHIGEAEKDIVGKTDFEFESYDLEKSGHVTNLDHAVLHLGNIKTTEETWYSAAGQANRFLITRFPISSSDEPTADMIGAIAIDVTEKQQAKAEGLQQMALFKTLFNASPDAILILEPSQRISLVNKQAEQLFAGQQSVLQNKKISDLIELDERAEAFNADSEALEKKLPVEQQDDAELRVTNGIKLDDTTFYCEVRLRHTVINNQKLIMCIVRDVSNKVRIEEHIKQAQKMEAIGQLSGGLAHDFNNLLGIVIGNLDLLADQFLKDEKAQKRINSALKAALSGAELTRRLLAFARKQALQPTEIDIKAVLDELAPILERSLKSDIKLNVRVHEPLYPAYVDVSQLENVIINLALNARDAMPSGGTLTLDVKATELDPLFIELTKEDISPGKYIHIAVSDTGHGIPAAVMANIFEPFFTTKEKGKGTGLGLPMAHGFAKQSKGMLQVYSEEGIGTTFHLYLPAAPASTQSQGLPENISSIPTGSETILVVDDEEELADIAETYLHELGYSVIKASSAEKALQLLELHNDINLVLTDIVMPEGMSGIELREKVNALYPEIKVLYASGFSAEAMAVKKGRELQTVLLQKPYRKRELGVAIRDCLDTEHKRHVQNS